MDPFFAWLESSWLSAWIREADSLFAFPLLVVLHALGMGVLVGASIATDLRVLGVAQGVPLAAMQKLLPVAWTGFAINAFSGAMLLIAYPTKALTNPLFYLKMVLVGAALAVLLRIHRDVLPVAEDAHADAGRGKRLAVLSLAVWVATIASGRLLAYTYTRLLVDVRGGF
jgi:hypothetical protein